MQITITYGSGEGLTKLAAFDHALWDAGIANYNLIKLSSVIPENSEIIIKKLNCNEIDIGHKLYVVLASHAEDIVGKEAWAGMGWVRAKNANGRGIFIEHGAPSKEECIELIRKSLYSVMEYRVGEYDEIQYKVHGIKCENKPVCSVVVAVYKSEDWKQN